eukprot:746648-Hanusia_phi.AAC.4
MTWARWLGGYLTQPIRMHEGGEPEQIDREEAVAIVDDLLSGSETCLLRTEGMKFVWLTLSDGISISVNGKSWELMVEGKLSQQDLGELLCVISFGMHIPKFISSCLSNLLCENVEHETVRGRSTSDMQWTRAGGEEDSTLHINGITVP